MCVCVCVCVCVCPEHNFPQPQPILMSDGSFESLSKGEEVPFRFFEISLLVFEKCSIFCFCHIGFRKIFPYCKTTKAKFDKMKKTGLGIDPRYKPVQVRLKSDFSFFQSILHKNGTLGTKTTKFLKLTLFRFFNRPNDRSRVLNAADFDSRPLFTL